MAFPALFALNFHSPVCTITVLCFKDIAHAKYGKNLLIIPVFFYFFHNTGLNLGKILPQDHTHFVFFAGFQWNKLGDSININNFNCNPEVMKVRGFN